MYLYSYFMTIEIIFSSSNFQMMPTIRGHVIQYRGSSEMYVFDIIIKFPEILREL